MDRYSPIGQLLLLQCMGDSLACSYTRMALVCFQVNDELACLLSFKARSRWTAGAWLPWQLDGGHVAQ